MEKLSRRLHHCQPPSGFPDGGFLLYIYKAMTRCRTVRKLDPCDAAYIAGLVDGEGTITLTVQHRGENRRLVLSISNTELPLLEFVRRVAGAGRITTKRTYSERHTPSFTYQISSRQALSLLSQIAPHLRTYKAKRATLALRNYVRLTPRNGKYTKKMKRERQEFERELLGALPQQSNLRLGVNDKIRLRKATPEKRDSDSS